MKKITSTQTEPIEDVVESALNYDPIFQKKTVLGPQGPGSGWHYYGPPPDAGTSYGSWMDSPNKLGVIAPISSNGTTLYSPMTGEEMQYEGPASKEMVHAIHNFKGSYAILPDDSSDPDGTTYLTSAQIYHASLTCESLFNPFSGNELTESYKAMRAIRTSAQAAAKPPVGKNKVSALDGTKAKDKAENPGTPDPKGPQADEKPVDHSHLDTGDLNPATDSGGSDEKDHASASADALSSMSEEELVDAISALVGAEDDDCEDDAKAADEDKPPFKKDDAPDSTSAATEKKMNNVKLVRELISTARKLKAGEKVSKAALKSLLVRAGTAVKAVEDMSAPPMDMDPPAAADDEVGDDLLMEEVADLEDDALPPSSSAPVAPADVKEKPAKPVEPPKPAKPGDQGTLSAEDEALMKEIADLEDGLGSDDMPPPAKAAEPPVPMAPGVAPMKSADSGGGPPPEVMDKIAEDKAKSSDEAPPDDLDQLLNEGADSDPMLPPEDDMAGAEAVQYEVLTSLADLEKEGVTAASVHMSRFGDDGPNPFWNLDVHGEPTARIYLQDQPRPDGVRAYFCSENYPKDISAAVEKYGLQKILATQHSRPLAIKIEKNKLAKDVRAKVVAEAKKVLAAKLAVLQDRYMDCMLLAAAGMDKNMFPEFGNPLKEAFYPQFKKASPHCNPMGFIEAAFDDGAASYIQAIMAKASKFMDMEPAAIAQIKETISESDTMSVEGEADGEMAEAGVSLHDHLASETNAVQVIGSKHGQFRSQAADQKANLKASLKLGK